MRFRRVICSIRAQFHILRPTAAITKIAESTTATSLTNMKPNSETISARFKNKSATLPTVLSSHLLAALCASLLIALPPTAKSATAGYALFDHPTDTISVAGDTSLSSEATFEATVLFTTTPSAFGRIFNEWTNGQEDKDLSLDAGPVLRGFAYPVGGIPLLAPATLTLNQWHHFAYVYDGAQERLYLDGSLAASRASSGLIANGNGNPFVGAIFRDGGIASSFLGLIDTLRISDDARYSGVSFSAPTGDLSSDANTLLLYNFDEAPGSTTISDLSGNGHDGTLGTGFDGATSPTFTSTVPEPSTLFLSGFGVALAACAGARKRRQSA
jgi:hypothetical protein